MAQQPDKLALVTGAASGIGAAVVEVLTAAGMTVIGADVAPGASTITLDVTDRAGVAEAVRSVTERWGAIDVLVNCAGIGRGGGLLDCSAEDWDTTIAVNLGGTVDMCRAVLPGMVARGTGAIVNIGSTFGLLARDHAGAYGLSKAGVIHLTRALAVELADTGVRVNCVCPGLIETQMTSMIFEPAQAAMHAANIQMHAMRRAGQPSEVADAIAFLVSDKASYITGTALPVDGGYTAGKWVIDPA